MRRDKIPVRKLETRLNSWCRLHTSRGPDAFNKHPRKSVVARERKGKERGTRVGGRERESERGVRRAPNFHRARFITGCARGGEKRIGGKDGGAATHYYEAELPNFAGRYVVSTSPEPHESGRERRETQD